MSFSFKPTNVGGEAQESVNTSSPVKSPASVPLGSMPLSYRADGTHEKSIFQIVLYVVFGVLILITVLLFAYQKYLVSRIDSQEQVLDETEKALGALDLEAMRSLSDRMKVVNQVLNEHVSVSSAFLILEKSIEHPVTYTKFSLIKGDGNKGYELQLGAIAPSYKAVAQQLDTLKSDAYKKDFIPKISFDALSLDPNGKVNFNLKMAILIQGKLPESIFPSLSDSSIEATEATQDSQNLIGESGIVSTTTPN